MPNRATERTEVGLVLGLLLWKDYTYNSLQCTERHEKTVSQVMVMNEVLIAILLITSKLWLQVWANKMWWSECSMATEWASPPTVRTRYTNSSTSVGIQTRATGLRLNSLLITSRTTIYTQKPPTMHRSVLLTTDDLAVDLLLVCGSVQLMTSSLPLTQCLTWVLLLCNASWISFFTFNASSELCLSWVCATLIKSQSTIHGVRMDEKKKMM